MPQATTKYFDSKRLLNLLGILPERLKEKGLNSEYVDQLSVLLALLQSHQNSISSYSNSRQLADRGCPLPVTPEQIRLINTLQ